MLELGLMVRECTNMSLKELKACLRRKHPVLMMLQAYGTSRQRETQYRRVWGEGHWVVAIGYDKRGVFFEDPSLEAVRGFIPYRDLDLRWHDVKRRRIKVEHYGAEVWHRPGQPVAGYWEKAEYIP